jgi:hypothetical protein
MKREKAEQPHEQKNGTNNSKHCFLLRARVALIFSPLSVTLRGGMTPFRTSSAKWSIGA